MTKLSERLTCRTWLICCSMVLKRWMIPIPPLLAAQPWAARLHQKDCGVPYGIALAAAALFVYPDTAFMKSMGM